LIPRLPQQTRILLIPEDERRSREYVISRGMVFGLAALLLLLVSLMILVLISYVLISREARAASGLRRDLAAAEVRMAAVHQLEGELEQMRSLQERLLVMLGVQPLSVGDEDTLAWNEEDFSSARTPLEELSNRIMTPPPDLWPVGGFVTQEFIAGDAARGVLPHQGIDIAAAEDTPLRAAGPGRVVMAGRDDFLGNFVEIQHGFGYVTVYGHCSRLVVRAGDRVDRGQVIGYLGATGEASAPHLHFEVWKDGVAVDPRGVIPGDPPR
jgi:murein DD-endopeptidase MepM/ murein hydrolase activator NlpD